MASGEGEEEEVEADWSATERGGEEQMIFFAGAGEGLESSLRLFPVRGNRRGGHGRTCGGMVVTSRSPPVNEAGEWTESGVEAWVLGLLRFRVFPVMKLRYRFFSVSSHLPCLIRNAASLTSY